MRPELSKRVSEARQARQTSKLETWSPYPKQEEFLALGATCDERMLRAGTQLGKTECGAYETALHLTGRYPPWWKGRRFRHPIRAWCLGESSTAVRDIMQRKLCGDPGVVEAFGTGFIPRADFADKPSLSHGSADFYDTIQVKHYTDGRYDGVSTLTFKTFEQGRAKLQGESIHFSWVDEEPSLEIYSEARARLAATKGSSIVTYTPLNGRTPLVSRFDEEEAPGRAMVVMTIHDCPHMGSSEEIARQIASYAPHEREARSLGLPLMGTGRVFLTPEDTIKEEPFQIPTHYFKLWGIDLGIGHYFAAVLIAWDKDSDVIHVTHGFKIKDATPSVHVPMMRAIAPDVPVAWPHDGNARDKGSGEPIVELYRQPMPGMPGLNMLDEHAQFEAGGYQTEAIVLEVIERLQSGRLKINAHLADLWAEYREYHRDKEGRLVRVRDDLLSALFKAIMMKRYARAGGLGSIGGARSRGRWVKIPDDEDPTGGNSWDIFTGRPMQEDKPRPMEWQGPKPPKPDWMD